MYSDVQELYAGGAADLEQELRRATDSAARSRATSSSNNAAQGTTQQRQGSSGSNTSAMSGSTLAPQPGANSTPATSGEAQNGSTSTVGPNSRPSVINRFVLLCVNGPRLPQLRQVPLTSQQVSIASHDNDLILFDNIRRAYIEVRRSYQPSFHPETPALVRLSVGCMHRVWGASQKLTTEVFKMLRLRWLVWWIGDDVLIVPKSAEFVKVCQAHFCCYSFFSYPPTLLPSYPPALLPSCPPTLLPSCPPVSPSPFSFPPSPSLSLPFLLL